MPQPRLILASASPRRSTLLSALGYGFSVRPTDVEEVLPEGLPPDEAAPFLARLKAEACLAWLDEAATCVLTADSVVVLDGEVLNKPTDAADARRMLARLCGRTQTVVTGVCLLRGTSARPSFEGQAIRTEVTLAAATPDEIADYVARQPPLDKAGAYGIQDWIGLAKATRLEGSYTNVMGLPTAEVYAMLIAAGLRPHWP